MNYSALLLAIAAAIFYYRVGDDEYRRGLLWASVSILISIAISVILHWGSATLLVAQALPFVGMTLYNAHRDPSLRKR